MNKKQRFGKIFGYSFFAVLALGLLGISIYFSIIKKAAHQAYLAQLKLNGKAGIPITIAEAQKYCSIPDSENSIDSYRAIFRAITTKLSVDKEVTKEYLARDKKLLLKNKGYHPSLNEHAQIQKEADLRYEKANQVVFQMLPKALKKPYFSIAIHFGDPMDNESDDWGNFSELSVMLQTQCLADAQKNPQNAIKELNQLISMANQVYQKKDAGDGMLREAIDLRAIQCGTEILKKNVEDPEVSAKVWMAASKIKPPDQVTCIPTNIFQAVYFTEHSSSNRFGQWLARGNSPPPPWVRFPWARDVFAAGLSQYGRAALGIYQTYGNNYPVLVQKLKDLASKSLYDGTPYVDAIYSCSSFLASTKFQVIRDQRVLMLACRLNSERLASKKLQSNLKKYGKLAINPMTKEPFNYQKQGSIISISSTDSSSKTVKLSKKDTLASIQLKFH